MEDDRQVEGPRPEFADTAEAGPVAVLADGPTVYPAGVTFRFHDDAGDVEGVRLVQEVVHGDVALEFVRAGDRWELRLENEYVDRVEYRFEIARRDGSHELVLDPANQRRALGAFGERSVVELAGYEPPPWIDADPPRGEVHQLELDAPSLESPQPVRIWSAPGTSAADELPLLVALDGFELEQFSSLLLMLDTLTSQQVLPPMRAALLHPTDRGAHYSANPVFAAALAEELLPEIARLAPHPAGPAGRAGLGASLGGLAMLHAQRAEPSTFGALFLESGSFLGRGRLKGFEYLPRIEAFVEGVVASPAFPRPVAVGMTCGSVEETLPDNVAMVEALRRQGYPVAWRVVRDGHNWVAWRDAWVPELVELLRRLWG